MQTVTTAAGTNAYKNSGGWYADGNAANFLNGIDNQYVWQLATTSSAAVNPAYITTLTSAGRLTAEP